jgi:hypothetical protein
LTWSNKTEKTHLSKKKKKAQSPSPPPISLPPSLSLSENSLKIVNIKNTKSKQKTIYTKLSKQDQ